MEDGNRYVEGMGGLWCVSLGFGNERPAEAAAKQIRELVADPATRAPFDAERKVGQHLVARAQAYGLIIRALGDRIGFSPPLVISADQIDDRYARFARALDEIWEWVKSKWYNSNA